MRRPRSSALVRTALLYRLLYCSPNRGAAGLALLMPELPSPADRPELQQAPWTGWWLSPSGPSTGAATERETFQAALGPIHPAASGAFAAAGRLGDAPVDRDIAEVQARSAARRRPAPLGAGRRGFRRRSTRPGGAVLSPSTSHRPAARSRSRRREPRRAGRTRCGHRCAGGDNPADAGRHAAVAARGTARAAGQGCTMGRQDERSTQHEASAPSRALPSFLPASSSQRTNQPALLADALNSRYRRVARQPTI